MTLIDQKPVTYERHVACCTLDAIPITLLRIVQLMLQEGLPRVPWKMDPTRHLAAESAIEAA